MMRIAGLSVVRLCVVALIATLAVLQGCSGPPMEEVMPEAAGPVANEVYEDLVEAVRAHHEGHFYEAVDLLSTEVPAAQLPALLIRAIEAAPRDEYSDLGYDYSEELEAIRYSFVRQGPESLHALAVCITKCSVPELQDLVNKHRESLAEEAAWIAWSYQTEEELQIAEKIARYYRPIRSVFNDKDNEHYWDAFSEPSPADFVSDNPPGFEDVEESYALPHPFSELPILWNDVTAPTKEYYQWYSPEGRVIEVPWSENRYNTNLWEITASSSAEGHGPELTVDGDLSTFWRPHPDDEQPWIRFKAPDRLSIWYNVGCCGLIVMVPAAAGSLDDYLANGRPTRIRMEYGDGTYRDHNIPYGQDGQSRTHLFEPRVRWKHVADEFTIRILQSEPGAEHQSPVLSEVGTEPTSTAQCGDGMTPIMLH